jgi:hypothetical protein
MSAITPVSRYGMTPQTKSIRGGVLALTAAGCLATFTGAQSNSESIISKTASHVSTKFAENLKLSPLEILRQSPTYKGFQTVDDPSELLKVAKQYLLESKWGRPCDAMFEYLTDHEPVVLLNLIRSGSLEPGFLSTAAEFAGQIDDPEQVIPLLRKLTLHDYPMVREGAVYGLASFISVEDVRQYLQKMSEKDSSPGVRSAAREMLED